MSSKLIASFVLAGGLAVAMGAGFLVGGLILGAALLFVALGQLALSHLAFFEERKRRLPRAVGPLPWVNLAMSYLLVAMALGLFLLKTLSDGRQEGQCRLRTRACRNRSSMSSTRWMPSALY